MKLSGCADQHEHCSSWAYAGECSKNPRYMLVKCKYSCHMCDTGKWYVHIDRVGGKIFRSTGQISPFRPDLSQSMSIHPIKNISLLIQIRWFWIMRWIFQSRICFHFVCYHCSVWSQTTKRWFTKTSYSKSHRTGLYDFFRSRLRQRVWPSYWNFVSSDISVETQEGAKIIACSLSTSFRGSLLFPIPGARPWERGWFIVG